MRDLPAPFPVCPDRSTPFLTSPAAGTSCGTTTPKMVRSSSTPFLVWLQEGVPAAGHTRNGVEVLRDRHAGNLVFWLWGEQLYILGKLHRYTDDGIEHKRVWVLLSVATWVSFFEFRWQLLFYGIRPLPSAFSHTCSRGWRVVCRSGFRGVKRLREVTNQV